MSSGTLWAAFWLVVTPVANAAEVQVVIFTEQGVAPPHGSIVVGSGGRFPLDADGRARLEVPVGTQEWRVEGPDGQRVGTFVLEIPGEGRGEALVGFGSGFGNVSLAWEGPVREAVTVEAGTAFVEGTVRDEKGRPLTGVRVFARGAQGEALTDAQGRFRLEVPAGSVEVALLKGGYRERKGEGVHADVGQTVALELEMVEAGVTLGTFTITAPRVEGGTAALLGERAEESQVVDTLSAEEMSRRGDSSAAGALRRVTGVTVVGGKYVYVRGLGERYSTTLLNGATLPSPEPERRVVPLDLFPTSLLESVVIQKTPSPDMPADFGGGVVQLRTRGIPEAPVLKVNVGGAWGSRTTGETGFLGPAEQGDGWAKGAEARGLPAEFEAAIEQEPLVLKSALPGARGMSEDDLVRLGAMLPNRWGLVETEGGFDKNLGVEAGRGWKLGKSWEVGGLGGLLYRDTYQHQEYRDRTWRQNNGKLEVQNDYQFVELSRRVQVGMMGVGEVRFREDQDIKITYLLSREGEENGRTFTGYFDEVGGQVRGERGQYIEREIRALQALGEHRFERLWGVELDWRVTQSTARRDEPDRRDILMETASEGGWRMRNQGGGNALFFSELDDQALDRGFDLRIPILGRPQGENWAVELAGGWSRNYRDRTVDTRRFVYNLRTSGEAGAGDFLTAEPHEIFAKEHIESGELQIAEATTATDNYTAVSTLVGRYVGATLSLPGRVSLTGGVREEAAAQQVRTFQLFTPEPVEEVATLIKTDLLPSAGLTWRILPSTALHQVQLRGAWGRTVNRPDFRELSPAVYNDVAGGREIAGNSELQRATIENVEARVEWFPTPDEVLSMGVFGKVFEDAIESNIIVSANSRISYINAAQAENAGVEAEVRKRLGAPGTLGESVVVGANGALIRSEVSLGAAAGAATSQVRALQGQSPWTFNCSLTWEPVEGDWAGGLYLNMAGGRISSVGEGGLPDLITQPAQLLDAAVQWSGIPGMRIGLRGGNLLDASELVLVGDEEVREVKRGISLGASLSFDWAAFRR